jgi:L-iditol 2-dehydrogenase
MRVALLERPGVVSIAERPTPEPATDEVMVAVESVGICGSDVHYFTHGRIGRYVVTAPLVLGHECSGRIVAVGDAVSPERVGERVAIEPGVPCRRCAWCKSGRYNLCPFVVFLATPPVDGGLAEYLVAPADFAHRLPVAMSATQGALVEPTAVAVHAARLGRAGLGDHCAVFGAGPVGLLLVQVLRAFGATVGVVDPNRDRAALAVELGATDGQDDEFDVCFDASGHPDGIYATVRRVRRGGRIVWIGLPPDDDVTVPAATLIDKEVELHGCFRYANAHPLAIELIATGRVQTEPLVSHRFPLSESERALRTLADRAPDAVKVVIEPQQV